MMNPRDIVIDLLMQAIYEELKNQEQMNIQPVIDLLNAQVVTLEGQNKQLDDQALQIVQEKQVIAEQTDAFRQAITVISNAFPDSFTTTTTDTTTVAPGG